MPVGPIKADAQMKGGAGPPKKSVCFFSAPEWSEGRIPWWGPQSKISRTAYGGPGELIPVKIFRPLGSPAQSGPPTNQYGAHGQLGK